jgi:hypothetical protein
MKWFKSSSSRSWGMLVLGVWLIVWGLVALVPTFKFARSDDLLAVVAIAAGVLVLMGR